MWKSGGIRFFQWPGADLGLVEKQRMKYPYSHYSMGVFLFIAVMHVVSADNSSKIHTEKVDFVEFQARVSLCSSSCRARSSSLSCRRCSAMVSQAYITVL